MISSSAPVPPSSPLSSPLPLSGIRVLDLSRLLPGPFATQILVDLGAEVIKIEDDQGDYARYSPPLAADGNSALFHALNRGKKSVRLDLKKSEDKQLFLQLLSSADVLMEGFRPGVMDKLGFPLSGLLSRFPRLIICSISGFGQDGPDALRAGHDVNYLAKAGVLGLMKEPTLLPVQVADLASGALPAALQILAALLAREKTGRGSIIDVSMCDNSYPLAIIAHSQRALSSAPIGAGSGTLTGSAICYSIYRTSDGGHIAVGALEPPYWQKLCQALGCSNLIKQQFSSGKAREQAQHQLQSIFIAKSTSEWREFFRSRDLMVEIVEKPEDIHDNNMHFRERGVTVRVPLDGQSANGKVAKKAVISFGEDSTADAKQQPGAAAQSIQVPRMPLRMSGIEPVAKRGPVLGEHDQEILGPIRAKL